MRRKEKEIKDQKLIELIIGEADICRIAMCEDNQPYLVPMNYGYKGGHIYLHSAREGKKIEMLKKNPRVCFEMETRVEIKTEERACNWNMRYHSVIGSGKVTFIEKEQEKLEALNIIMERYMVETKFEYTKESVTKVQLLKIEIAEIAGKKSGY